MKVLEGQDGTGTQAIGPGQSARNTAEGSFHLVCCVTSNAAGAGDSGNTGS